MSETLKHPGPCWSCGSESILVRGAGELSVYACQDCGVFTECTPGCWRRRASGWISVDEPPEDMGYYLTVDADGLVGENFLYGKGSEFLKANDGYAHWQPLPEPPEAP